MGSLEGEAYEVTSGVQGHPQSTCGDSWGLRSGSGMGRANKRQDDGREGWGHLRTSDYFLQRNDAGREKTEDIWPAPNFLPTPGKRRRLLPQ